MDDTTAIYKVDYCQISESNGYGYVPTKNSLENSINKHAKDGYSIHSMRTVEIENKSYMFVVYFRIK